MNRLVAAAIRQAVEMGCRIERQRDGQRHHLLFVRKPNGDIVRFGVPNHPKFDKTRIRRLMREALKSPTNAGTSSSVSSAPKASGGPT